MATAETDIPNRSKNPSKHILRSIYVVRECLAILLWKLFLCKVFFWILGALLHTLPVFWPTWQSLVGDVSLVWIYSSLVLFEVLCLGYLLLSWDCRYYLITPDKIIFNQGVIAKRQEVCAIKNIESMDLTQSILGRIFSFGTIKLFAPTLNHSLHMNNIHRPQKKMHVIEHLLPNTSSRPTHSRNEIIMIPRSPAHYASP